MMICHALLADFAKTDLGMRQARMATVFIIAVVASIRTIATVRSMAAITHAAATFNHHYLRAVLLLATVPAAQLATKLWTVAPMFLLVITL